jgi:hypothetical protein
MIYRRAGDDIAALEHLLTPAGKLIRIGAYPLVSAFFSLICCLRAKTLA